MTFLRSRDGDVCPLTGEKLRPGVMYLEPERPNNLLQKWHVEVALPCTRGEAVEGVSGLRVAGQCPHLAQSWAGSWTATVQCRASRDRK